MMNKKETLISVLRGRADDFKTIETLVADMTIMTETGHVDCIFLMELLEAVNINLEMSNKITDALQRLMTGEFNLPEKTSQKNTKTQSPKVTIEDVLKGCILEDNILKLPSYFIPKEIYGKVKQYILEAGGSWCGGKTQGFTFPFNAERVFEKLNKGQRCNLKQEFQYFQTPDNLADWLVELAGGVTPEDRVLEPSAGQGALIKAIHRVCPQVNVECYELMPENKEILAKMENITIKGNDFLTLQNEEYTKIIANPPFSGNQDIIHLQKMYDLLQYGGVVAAITSRHWQLSNEKRCISFREWLETVKAKVYEIDAREFVSSGTSIATLAIVIKK